MSLQSLAFIYSLFIASVKKNVNIYEQITFPSPICVPETLKKYVQTLTLGRKDLQP